MLKPLLTSIFISVLLIPSARAESERYRLIWNDDPATTMTIGWNSKSGKEGTHFVYYGLSDHGQDTSAYAFRQVANEYKDYKGMDNTFVRLTNLQPNTAYYFVIGDEDSRSERFWFKTAPNGPSERLSIIAGGDSRDNRGPRQNANRLVSKLRPHAVMFGGDFTNNSTNNEWRDWLDDWQLTIGQDGRMIPIIPTRGNHEDSNDELINFFDTNDGVYYGLTLGGNLLRIYTLNSQTSIAGDQTDWLEEDLKAHCDISWKLSQYHKPMRPHVEDKTEGFFQYAFWAPLFYTYNMNLVIECDAHTVKTTWPIRPDPGNGEEGFVRDDKNGTTYIGEGCWGAPLRADDDPKSWTRASGSFNQFKWIFIDSMHIEARTVVVGNDSATNAVGTVDDADIFAAPPGLEIWNPVGGAVVNVFPPAFQADIILPPDMAHFPQPQTITIKTNAGNAQSIVDVNFFVNDSLIGITSNFPYNLDWQIPDSGTYVISAKVVDIKGEAQESCSPITITADLREVSTGVKICEDRTEFLQIFPNPLERTESLKVRFTSEVRQTAIIQLFSPKGELVFRRKWRLIIGENTTTMPISDLSTGIYYLRLSNGKMEAVRALHVY